jgi:hypothetical protein
MTKMKNMRKYLALAVLAALTAVLPAAAQQNTLGTTTLSAAIANGQTTAIRVASATGITVAGGGVTQTIIYIDTEEMNVLAVSGTQITVFRGYDGTLATPHLSGANVLIGRPIWFNHATPTGGCTPANVLATPYINTLTAMQWLCSTLINKWVPGWGNPGSSQQPIGPTAAVASTAGTITPSGPLFHVTGNSAITGFTLPVGYNGSPFCIIPDGTFTTTSAGNIALASTAVVSKQLCYSYDPNAAKPFFPSY